jgi:hypothetical protein
MSDVASPSYHMKTFVIYDFKMKLDEKLHNETL